MNQISGGIYIEDIEIIKQRCLEKWEYSDERIVKFSNEFESWINQFSEEFKPLCCKMIENFDYYASPKVVKEFKKIHLRLLEFPKFDPEYTIYTVIHSKLHRLNSSVEYLMDYKKINTIYKHSCIINITTVLEELMSNITSIVLIDDFCGTGKTITDYLDENLSIYRNVEIFVIVIHIMLKGKEKLLNYAKENNLKLNIICFKSTDKLFNSNIFADNIIVKQSLKNESIEKQIPESCMFGERKSQSLVALHNGTPNNTIGIFRKDTENFFSIFPRHEEEKPFWLGNVKKNKINRGKQNQEYARGIENG